MTASAYEAGAVLPTTIIDVGPAALAAPLGKASHTLGTFGEMWLWTGDGVGLFSLVLVARYDGEASGMGARHRLLSEVERIRKPLLGGSEGEAVRAEIAVVPGATAAFVAHVDGIREGVPVHNLVLVATTPDRMHLLHVLTPDTETGRDQALSMASSLRLAS